MIAQLVSMSSGPNGCRFDSRVEPKIVKTKITNPISLIGYKSNQNQIKSKIQPLLTQQIRLQVRIKK